MTSYINTLMTSDLIKSSNQWPLFLMAIDFLEILVKICFYFHALHAVLLPLFFND